MKTTMKTTARVKRVVIVPEILFHIFGTGTSWLVERGIPIGSRVRGVTHDPYANTINVFVEHESFPEIEAGSVAETIDMRFTKI